MWLTIARLFTGDLLAKLWPLVPWLLAGGVYFVQDWRIDSANGELDKARTALKTALDRIDSERDKFAMAEYQAELKAQEAINELQRAQIATQRRAADLQSIEANKARQRGESSAIHIELLDKMLADARANCVLDLSTRRVLDRLARGNANDNGRTGLPETVTPGSAAR